MGEPPGRQGFWGSLSRLTALGPQSLGGPGDDTGALAVSRHRDVTNAQPSLREGGERPQSSADGIEDALGVLVDLLVREAQDGDASSAKESVAETVTPLTTAVRFAIDIDGEPSLHAEEVGEVGVDRELAAELAAVDLAPAEALPKERLGSGGEAAMATGQDNTSRKRSLHDG